MSAELVAIVPDHFKGVFEGKRVALIGLHDTTAESVCTVLARVGAVPRLLDCQDGLQYIDGCDVVIFNATSDTDSALIQTVAGCSSSALILAADHQYLMALPPIVQVAISEYLADDWEPEEILLRIKIALSRRARAVSEDVGEVLAPQTSASLREGTGNPRIMVVDDDPIVLSIVRATLAGTINSADRAGPSSGRWR